MGKSQELNIIPEVYEELNEKSFLSYVAVLEFQPPFSFGRLSVVLIKKIISYPVQRLN